MAKCLRCGRELSQPKCECGFDVCEGVYLLTELDETYIVSDRARKEALAALTRVLGAVAEKKDYDEAALELAEALLRLGKKLDMLKKQETEIVSQDEWGVLDREGTLRIRDGVTMIPEAAYREREDIKAVVFSDTVTKIGKSAFSQSALQKVQFSDGITEIGEGAFWKCWIGEVKLPKQLKNLGSVAFSDNWSLKQIEIPSGVKAIESFTFYQNRFLETVKIPEGVTKLGANCFSGCGWLREVYLPSTLRSIEKWAFDLSFTEDRCRKEMRIYFNGTKSQWQQVEKTPDFADVEPLVVCTVQEPVSTVYRIPGRPTMIKYKEYFQNDDLVRVVIPDSVTHIGGRAFEGCKNLEEIVIPDSVTVIGEAAFLGCRKLKRILLPRRLTSVGDYAFEHCVDLEEVAFAGTVRSIGKGAFTYCSRLERIDLPEGLIAIESGAFYSCSALKEVRLPGTLEKLMSGAFVSCWDVRLYFDGSEKQWNALKQKMFWETFGDKTSRKEYKRLLECVTITRR